MKKIAVIMGSASDAEVVKPCVATLKRFNVNCEIKVLSAHRTPKEAIDFAASAKDNGFGAIIAFAGKAAHLAGVIAGNTVLPVIGVPVLTSALGGLDSLLSVVQMPSGVPVATVALNGGENAAILALQMLAIDDNVLSEKLENYKAEMRDKVLAQNEEIENKF